MLVSSFMIPATSSCQKLSDSANRLLADLCEMQRVMEKTCRDTSDMLQGINKLVDEVLEAEEIEVTEDIKQSIDVAAEETEEQEVMIVCKNVAGDTIKAEPVNKKLFSIKTPDTDILLKLKRNILSITVEQEEKQEVEEQENRMFSWCQNKACVRRYIEHPLNLAATTVDYNKDEKALIITIPFAEKEPQNTILK